MNLRMIGRPVLAGLMLSLGSGLASGQTFVKPGDSGSIEFSIESNDASFEAAAGVRIEVEAPSYFLVKEASIRGPINVQAGETKTFVIDYEIAADATEGSFYAVLKPTATISNIEPELHTIIDLKATFRVDRTPPELTVTSGEGTLGETVVTSDGNISIVAVDKPVASASGLKSVAVYQAVAGQYTFWFWSDRASFSTPFPGHAWYFVNACDKAGNCAPMRFGVFDEDEDVPSPPAAPGTPGIPPNVPPGSKTPPAPSPAPGPRRAPGTPAQYPRPTPGPGQPACVATSVASCLPNPPAPVPPGGPPRCYPGWGFDPRCYRAPVRETPHDPNAMYGPQGSVTPGQLMTYTIEFENEGTGEALGVYVEDVLDPALDDATLTLRDMQAVNFATATQAAASFPWAYDAQTRTVTLLAGDAASRQGGRFILELRLKADSPPGTVIRNQAVVYFPNALEATPTNTIVSAVPLPTQLAATGATSATYSSVTRLEARLSAGNTAVERQPVSFQLFEDSLTAVTDSAGTAAGSVFVSAAAGRYDLGLRYASDDFYYLPSAANVDFVVNKRAVLLQTPFAAARATETVRLSLTLTDDRGEALERQMSSSQTVFLEALDDVGAATPLASALLSGASAYFEFAFPLPVRLTQALRARFEGDPYYAAASSTGSLRLIDTVAPQVAIQTPSGGTYFEAQSIQIAFVVSDDVDPAPSAAAMLAGDGGSVPVQKGQSVPVSALSVGNWRLIVTGTDWAGNTVRGEGGIFTVAAGPPPPSDTTAPSLVFSLPQGALVSTATPTLVVQYSDLDSGVAPTSVRLSLDAVDVTTLAVVAASSASFTPAAALIEGTHTFTASVADLAGNAASASSTFFLDSISPVTALLVNGLPSGATSLVIISTDAVGFSAVDTGAGVSETLYTLDGSTIASVFVSTFSLAVGTHSLAYRSLDQAANVETARSALIQVLPLDGARPLLRLDYPGSSGLGVEQAMGGIVNVRGSVLDENLLSWKLDAAPGAGASSGFVQLAAGPSNISGLIFAWDTNSLSGYQTLRLSALDSFGNEASITAAVFIGNPVFTLAIGRKDSDYIVSSLKNPTGIAVRSDGLIWVASAQNDQLLLLTSTGAVLAQAGGGPQHGHQNDDLRFSGPQGLALDVTGYLYIADTNKNRVVRLSADGSQLLLELGKEHRGRPRPGNGSGEFKHPWDVAVDLNGDIYVADTGNRRIQVFDAQGGFLREFGQDVLLSTSEIRGIALTSEGLWVSDKELERIYLFSRSGAVIKSIGDADSAAGEISRTRGLASDRLGALYVIEPNRDRAQKFDPQGRGLLAFGERERAGRPDRNAKRYLTQPIDAALAPDGSIWITDTGRDRIVRYALPSNGGYGVASIAPGGGSFSSSDVEPARRVVDHKDGARVERDDGTGVRVPGNALTADLELTVDKGDESKDAARKQDKRQAKRVQAVSGETEFGPEGTIFAVPVTLSLAYDAAKIASLGVKEDDLKVHYWNPVTGDWEALPSTVDKQNKTVNAPTTHFSLYQLMAPGGIGAAAGGVDAAFLKRDIFVFPNPARAGAKPTVHVEVGIADKVTVRIFDAAGRELRKATFQEAPAVIDSGSGPRYAYEFVWDSYIASGVYYYAIEAEKAGAAPLRASGKLGVVR